MYYRVIVPTFAQNFNHSHLAANKNFENPAQNSLAEFRVRGREKNCKSILSGGGFRPKKFYSPRKCELFAQSAKSLRAVEAHPPYRGKRSFSRGKNKNAHKQVTGLLMGFYEKREENEKRLYRFLHYYTIRGLLKKIAGIY